MDLRAHRIPDSIFADLARGGGGPAAISHLTAVQYSKHLLLLRLVVELAQTVGHKQATQAKNAYDLLAEIQREDDAAVDAVLRHPPVGAWALHTIRALREVQARERALPGQLAGLAMAAAVRACVDCSAEVPVRAGAVMLPTLGRIDVPGDSDHKWTKVTARKGRADAARGDWIVRIPTDPSADAPGWQGLRTLSALGAGQELRILIEDLDACRLPGSANLAERLSELEAGRWQVALREAWDVLTGHHQPAAAEIAAAIRAFTPLAPPEHGQLSATSAETFGNVAMSQPVDGRSLAVTLVHEMQHAKLSALLDLTPLVVPDHGTLYYAPWRDDPRPLSGLLQGAYAFMGVAGFWRQQLSVIAGGTSGVRAETEFARWRDASITVVATLAASGRLTREGAIFVSGMNATLTSWAGESVSPEARKEAGRLANEHRARWMASNRAAAGAIG